MPGSVVIDDGRNPFEVWLLAICVLTGVVGLLPGDRVRSTVIEPLPSWAAALYYGGLLVSGAFGLLALTRPMHRSLLWERAALYLLGGLLSGYSVALLVLTGFDLAAGAMPMAAAAVACAARVYRITRRDLPRFRKLVASLAKAAS